MALNYDQKSWPETITEKLTSLNLTAEFKPERQPADNTMTSDTVKQTNKNPVSGNAISHNAISHNTISQSNPRAIKNPWVLSWILLVIIVLGVNIGFISLAFITSPGLVDQDYYENAQNYEENLVKYRTARAALGWTYQTDFPTHPVIHNKALYRVSVVDKAGLPLTAARLRVNAYRPSDASADFDMHFSEIGAGIYEAEITYLLKGRWEITIDIEHEGKHFSFTRHVSISGE